MFIDWVSQAGRFNSRSYGFVGKLLAESPPGMLLVPEPLHLCLRGPLCRMEGSTKRTPRRMLKLEHGPGRLFRNDPQQLPSTSVILSGRVSSHTNYKSP